MKSEVPWNLYDRLPVVYMTYDMVNQLVNNFGWPETNSEGKWVVAGSKDNNGIRQYIYCEYRPYAADPFLYYLACYRVVPLLNLGRIPLPHKGIAIVDQVDPVSQPLLGTDFIPDWSEEDVVELVVSAKEEYDPSERSFLEKVFMGSIVAIGGIAFLLPLIYVINLFLNIF